MGGQWWEDSYIRYSNHKSGKITINIQFILSVTAMFNQVKDVKAWQAEMVRIT